MNLLVATTHEKQTALVGENASGKLLEALVTFEHLLDLSGELVQTVDDLVATLGE